MPSVIKFWLTENEHFPFGKISAEIGFFLRFFQIVMKHEHNELTQTFVFHNFRTLQPDIIFVITFLFIVEPAISRLYYPKV